MQFRPETVANGAAGAIDRIERRIRPQFPQVSRIFIEARLMTKGARAAAA